MFIIFHWWQLRCSVRTCVYMLLYLFEHSKADEQKRVLKRVFSGFSRWNCYFIIVFTMRYVNFSTLYCVLCTVNESIGWKRKALFSDYFTLIIYYIFWRLSLSPCVCVPIFVCCGNCYTYICQSNDIWVDFAWCQVALVNICIWWVCGKRMFSHFQYYANKSGWNWFLNQWRFNTITITFADRLHRHTTLSPFADSLFPSLKMTISWLYRQLMNCYFALKRCVCF